VKKKRSNLYLNKV